jgi:hypothetical protein
VNGPRNSRSGNDVRGELVARLARWSYLGGTEGDPEWALLDSLSPAERRALSQELEQLEKSIRLVLQKLRGGADDLYGG